jgi:hypothetical protein
MAIPDELSRSCEEMESTYDHANTLSDDRTGREIIQDVDGLLEPYHNCSTVTSVFLKRLCLVLKDCNNFIRGITTFELRGKLIFDQVCPCPFLVLAQGSFKE